MGAPVKIEEHRASSRRERWAKGKKLVKKSGRRLFKDIVSGYGLF